jgi:toxin-antitoxin system PIN domain toxin
VILPDVNVLIYALRRDVPQHVICKAWLHKLFEAHQRFGISPLALSAVVRIATDQRIYNVPSSLDEAFDFCQGLIDDSYSILVEPGQRHWEIFTRLCVETSTVGRRVTDAWYAALAIEWNCEWITFDRDFGRFPGLKWRTPEL